MSMSAARIRSISIRYRIAEQIAFPDLRDRCRSLPHNTKSSIPSQFRGDSTKRALARACLA
jgi:hypothetical protein